MRTLQAVVQCPRAQRRLHRLRRQNFHYSRFPFLLFYAVSVPNVDSMHVFVFTVNNFGNMVKSLPIESIISGIWGGREGEGREGKGRKFYRFDFRENWYGGSAC